MCNRYCVPFYSILESKLPSFLRRQESMFFSTDTMDPSFHKNNSHLEKSLDFVKISFVRFSRHFVTQNDTLSRSHRQGGNAYFLSFTTFLEKVVQKASFSRIAHTCVCTTATSMAFKERSNDRSSVIPNLIRYSLFCGFLPPQE